MSRPDGQVLFSDAHWEEVKKRVNGTVTPPNYMNDAGFLVSEANDFVLDPSKDRYDYMDSATSFDTAADAGFTPWPYNPYDAPNICTDNIHCAAIVAAATNDQAMATDVLDEILVQANDDKLDFGNGTSKTNATYGTAVRHDKDDLSQIGHPHFLIVEKVIKHLNSYTIIKTKAPSLISLTTAEEDRINDWFYDAKVLYKGYLDNTLKTAWGTDWRNKNFVLHSGLNRVMDDNSYYSTPFFADSAGVVNNNYTNSELQRYGLVNTRQGYAHYTSMYALLYNNQADMDFFHDYYEMVMEMAVYPDGMILEYDRSKPSVPDQGINAYVWVNTQGLSIMAATHKIASLNGLPSMSGKDGNELYEFTTDKGWDSYSSANNMATGVSPTSGGQKNLKLIIDAGLKSIQQNYGSVYGWSPTRHVTFSPYGMIGSHQTDIRGYLNAIAHANMYYDDPLYADVIQQVASAEMHTPVLKYNSGLSTLGAWKANQGFWGALLAFDDLYSGLDGILNETVSEVVKRKKASTFTGIN